MQTLKMVGGESTRKNLQPTVAAPLPPPTMTRNGFHDATTTTTTGSSATCHSFGHTGARARVLMDSFLSPILSCVKPTEYPTTAASKAPSAISSAWASTPTHREPHPVSPHSVAPSPPVGVPVPVQKHVTVWQPHENDVLCGRGGGSGNPHKGNARFRELIASQREYYDSLTKKQKMMLARLIVDLIRNVGGRFLARDTTSGGWYDIGLPRSLEKTSQALREKPQSASSSSSSSPPPPPLSLMDSAGSSSGSSADNHEHNNGKTATIIASNNVSDPDASSSSSSSSSSQSSQDTSTASPTCSEITAKVANHKCNRVTTAPRLVLPAHLQELYAPALNPLTAAPQASPHLNHQPKPFVRPVPHPMPLHDFHYRYDPPISAPPAHHQETPPSSLQIVSGMFRPPSSAPSPAVSFGSTHSRPLGLAYPVPVPQSSQRSSFHPVQQQPLVGLDDENVPPAPNGSSSSATTTTMTSSPLRQQLWKRPRTQVEEESKGCNNLVGANSFPSSLLGRSSGGAEVVLESKLSLQERVIRAPPSSSSSPHLVPPSRLAGRQSRPPALSSDQDGMAALSTAAFLRLDEEGETD